MSSRSSEREGFTPGARHLIESDPVMARVVRQVGPDAGVGPKLPSDRYGALLRGIVGQQLSTTSALAIFGRLTERFGGRTPTPQEILGQDPDELRTAVGLSHAKTKYLRSLAHCVIDGTLELDRLDELDDATVEAQLTTVSGIGTWTARIFMMFVLRRPDVLADGDLWIRRAVRDLYELPAMPRTKQVAEIAEPWRPQRTLACVYLWRLLEVSPVT